MLLAVQWLRARQLPDEASLAPSESWIAAQLQQRGVPAECLAASAWLSEWLLLSARVSEARGPLRHYARTRTGTLGQYQAVHAYLIYT